jgi:hypothetical protein
VTHTLLNAWVYEDLSARADRGARSR